VKNIRDLRVERGMSAWKLAILIGSDPSAVYAWEVKKRRPHPENVRRLCEVFGVSTDELDLAPFKRVGRPVGYRSISNG